MKIATFLLIFFSIFSTPLFADELLVSAASSLTDAVKEIAASYQLRNKKAVLSLNFASSGALRGQIEKGAPVDIFLSASSKHMDILEQGELVISGSRVNFAKNSLCLIAPRNNVRVMISDFSELTKVNVTRIGIGSPSSVPVGQYAKQALEHLKLWSSLSNRFIYGENVRQVLDYVSRGEVDFGLVYTTDALIRKDSVSVVNTVPDRYHSPIIYPAAIVKGTKNISEARRFIEYLQSDASKQIFRKYGFSVK